MSPNESQVRAIRGAGSAAAAADEARLRHAIESVEWERRGLLQRLGQRRAG